MWRAIRITACAGWMAGWAVAAVSAREIPLTILHTTDLHGCILPPLATQGGIRHGSLLRCATVIESIRAAEPNVLLLDGGDAIQGSPESRLTQGVIVWRAMEWLRYDATALGNHDLDWGPGPLADLCRDSSVPLLAANVSGVPGGSHPLPCLKPYLIREIEGVRVAIVGLTTPGIPGWLRPEIIPGLLFERSRSALETVLPDVRREDPDVLVLLAHQGLPRSGKDDDANEIPSITRQFPEFDVMLGGHLHWVVPGMRMGDILFLQSGSEAQGVGVVRLVYDTVRRCVTRKEADYVAVDEQVPEHAELKEYLRADLDRTESYLTQEVGSSETEWESGTTAPGVSPIQQLISAAIARSARAPIVFHGVLSEENLSAGPIRMRDIWRIIPYENRIGVAWLTPGEIRDVLEEGVAYYGSGHALGAYGLSFSVDLSAPPGERVSGLRLSDGRKIHPKKRLKTAFNSHTLASAGGRYPGLRRIVERPTSRLKLTDIDTRKAVIDYVKTKSPLTLPPPPPIVVNRGRSGE